MPELEIVTFPEWFTPEMIAACEGMTQVQVNAQNEFMLQQGCIPPQNCAGCTNTGCFTAFRDTLIANSDLPEIV